MCFQSLFEWAAPLHPFLTQPIEKPKLTPTAAQPPGKAGDEESFNFAILQGSTLAQAQLLTTHRNAFLL